MTVDDLEDDAGIQGGGRPINLLVEDPSGDLQQPSPTPDPLMPTAEDPPLCSTPSGDIRRLPQLVFSDLKTGCRVLGINGDGRPHPEFLPHLRED